MTSQGFGLYTVGGIGTRNPLAHVYDHLRNNYQITIPANSNNRVFDVDTFNRVNEIMAGGTILASKTATSFDGQRNRFTKYGFNQHPGGTWSIIPLYDIQAENWVNSVLTGFGQLHFDSNQDGKLTFNVGDNDSGLVSINIQIYQFPQS